MHSFGPVYCETHNTLLNIPYLIEPINALTNVFSLIAAIVIVYFVWEHSRRSWDLYVLAFLLAVTGIGSFFWHGFRIPEALVFDVFPALIFFFLFLFLWSAALRDRWFGYAIVLTVIVAQSLFTRFIEIGTGVLPFFIFFGFITMIGFALILYTYYLRRDLLRWGSTIVFLAALAAIFRIVDLSVCDYFPIGTHFLWQIIFGVAAYVGIVFLVKLRNNE